MMSRKRLLIAGGGAALLLLLVLGAVLWPPLAWIVLGALQVLVLVLLLDTRRTLSARLFATTAKLERQLNARRGGRSAPADGALRVKAGVSSAAARGASTAKAGTSASGSPAAAPPGDVRTVLGSRIFDVEWYETQVDETFPDAAAAAAHYLELGRRAGFTPHPLFDPAWISAGTWNRAGEDPLLRYLRNADDAWSGTTSAFFDPAGVDDELPESEYGPLAAFLLHRGAEATLPTAPDATGVPEGLTLSALRQRLMRSSREWREREAVLLAARGAATPPESDQDLARTLEEFDASERRPLVSVVLPTWNRARSLRAAMASVQAQTYQNWELLVADDGSIDDTAHVLSAEVAKDGRIVPLHLPHEGVSAARNAALAAARGEYIAFLDSDKEWDAEFLRTMVGVLEVSGKDAAYAVTAVSFGDRTVHNTVPATLDSLLASNSVDQTAIVARQSLIARAGGFDTSLRRAVDYDLLLSLAELTELALVPYVGVRYTEDDQDPHRISESQSVAWNFHVRDTHLWRAHTPQELVPGKLTVIIDGVSSATEMDAVLSDIDGAAGDLDHEVIAVTASNDWPLVRSLSAAAHGTLDLRFVYAMAGGSRPLYVNAALRQARGEHVLLLAGGHRLRDVDLPSMLERLHGSGVGALHPVVLDRTRLIHDAGAVFAGTDPDPVPFLRGVPPEWPRWASELVPVPAAPWPLLTTTEAALEIRGATTKLRSLWADVDFSRRIAETAGPVMLDTTSTVQLMRETGYARAKKSAADVRMIDELWGTAPRGTDALLDAAGVQADFRGSTAISAPDDPGRWTAATWRARPLLSVREGVPRLRWALKTAAPANERAVFWGDLHFGNSLAAALRELGQEVVVDYGPNAARPTTHLDDVVLALRGLDRIPLPVATTRLLWVISHPDEVTAAELAGYDKAYAASPTWPGLMASQWGADVTTLLQCTDPARFFIDAPEAEVAGKLVMVGNSRDQYRPVVWHTVNAGLPVAVYGHDWSGRVPEENIAGTYVPNEELRRYYQGATWALNDHWPDMRDQGFLSNRLFDILASGGRLLTDDVSGLEEIVPASLLPHGVATFQSPAELLSIIERGPEHYYDEGSLAAVSEHVRAHHSFTARAQVMLEDALALRRTRGE